MGTVDIVSQEVMDKFLLSVHWEHAFVREMHATSPSYLNLASGTVNPDALVDVRFLVLTDDKGTPGVELYFRETEQIGISFISDFRVKGIVKEDQLGHKSIHFSFGSNSWIISRQMSFKLLGIEVSGNHYRYGGDGS